MKRGVSNFPFLLIFIIIAGSIILIFFFSFGSDIFQTSAKINKLTVLKNIDQQLAAFSLPSNAVATIDLGIKAEITTTCSSSLTKFTFQDKTINSQKIIISPIKIKARSLKAWTLSWDYPFKIDNFYYLFPREALREVKLFYKESPDYNTNPEAKKFIDDFKINIQKIQNINDVQAPTTDKKILFLLSSQESTPNSNNIRIVKIGFNQDLSTRKIEVFEQGSLLLTTNYLGSPLALAAAFSPENYECIKNQALTRLNNIVSLYEHKVNLLEGSPHIDHVICKYSEPGGIRDNLEQLKDPLNNPSAAQELQDINKNFRLRNCPQLYSK